MPVEILHGDNAIELYKSAFDATGLWRLGEAADIVAGLAFGEAKFFLRSGSTSNAWPCLGWVYDFKN